MISVRQVHFIEEHCEAIGRRAMTRLRRELPEAAEIADSMILERVQDLFGHLGDWLSAGNANDLATRYQQIGHRRAVEGVPLHGLVRMLQLIHQSAIDYIRESEFADNSVSIRSESELEYRIDRFFDLVIYHIVKGYEAGCFRSEKAARSLAL